MAYKDSWNYISKLTLGKVSNMILVTLSFYISRLIRKPILWGSPVSITIEPTTSCNLRCPECPSGLRSFTRPTGMVEHSFFEKIIDEQKHSLSYLLLYFQGEPYLHPKFLKMVEYASNQKVYTATSTNAHYLTDDVAQKTIESGLDRLIISIDGTSQDTYEQYRIGGSLEKVIEGTKNMVKWKKKLNSTTPHLLFQFLVVRPNEHQIEEVKTLANELGVDEVKFKTAQLYDFENGNDLMPTIDKYSRYRKSSNGKFEIKNTLDDHCWKMWHSSVITWDGNVVPCCFDKDASHAMGNLTNTSFEQIWQSREYKNFRKSILKGRSHIDICTNCTEGTKVWA